MNDTNHPARRLRHGQRPTEKLVFEDDAANKAAEEGELLRDKALAAAEEWANAEYFHANDLGDGGQGAVDRVNKAEIDCRAAINELAADRASRQVANKAVQETRAAYKDRPTYDENVSIGSRDFFEMLIEYGKEPSLSKRMEIADFVDSHIDKLVANKAEVEPVAYLVWRTVQRFDGDIEDWIEVGKKEDICDDGSPAFPVYATPPATTGASTALTDERKRAMFEEWATKQGGYDLSPYNWRVKSVGGVPYTGYVRPYKQDRTVHAFEGFIAALGEVAAQAGQVAVPDEQLEWSHDLQERLIAAAQDCDEHESVRQVMAEAACLLAALTGVKAPTSGERQEGGAS